MKKGFLILGLAMALSVLPRVPAYADASQNGCKHSDNRAAGCKPDPVGIPEPGSFALLTMGLAALAVVLGYKRLARN